MGLPNTNISTKLTTMIAKRALFEGRVQGVGFRYEAKQIALGFDVTGWIRNLANGDVELQLMGEEEEVDEFIQELSEESTMAHYIKNMHAHEIPLFEGIRGLRIL